MNYIRKTRGPKKGPKRHVRRNFQTEKQKKPGGGGGVKLPNPPDPPLNEANNNTSCKKE